VGATGMHACSNELREAGCSWQASKLGVNGGRRVVERERPRAPGLTCLMKPFNVDTSSVDNCRSAACTVSARAQL
jgi:hypothetical protein